MASNPILHTLVTSSIRQFLGVICQIQADELIKVPQSGPLILVANHVNSIEVPLVYTLLQPRPVTGFAKSETWQNPVMGALFDIWGTIPLKRDSADTQAIKIALNALAEGKILAVAPEGTRSRTGNLIRANPGIALLAVHSKAPILPIAYYGHENFSTNIKHLKRTRFTIKVGNPFHIHLHEREVTKSIRQQIADEIMYQVALLLPPQYRGEYANLDLATHNYLYFIN